VISMVLVTERSKHLPQGAPADPLQEKEVRPPPLQQPALLRRARPGSDPEKH
jgi:hypothetical protein